MGGNRVGADDAGGLFVPAVTPRFAEDLVSLGAASGGLVGFVALLPITLSLPWTVGLSEAGTLVLILAVGPGLTTILGQIGGAWGGRRAAYFAKFAGANAIAAESLELSAAMGWRAIDRVSDSNASEPRLQFSIRHLLWIFVWLSLILSVIKLCRLPFEFVLPVLVGWFVYQLATLSIGSYLARRLAHGGAIGAADVPHETSGKVYPNCVFHVEQPNRGSAPNFATRRVVSRETVGQAFQPDEG